MKFLGTTGVLFIMLGVYIMLPAAASAETISVERKIVVQAKVMPAQYIVIDGQGKIMEIGSNTNADVVPQVFLTRPGAENQQPMTPELYAQYRGLVPAGKSHPGVLYKYQAPKLAAKNDRLILSFNI